MNTHESETCELGGYADNYEHYELNRNTCGKRQIEENEEHQEHDENDETAEHDEGTETFIKRMKLRTTQRTMTMRHKRTINKHKSDNNEEIVEHDEH